jgi:aryl-alcohol dehydrogenase-like predicted oxidoreductase
VRSISGLERSPVQTSIRYVLKHPAISSAVIGFRTMQQLEEAVNTFDTPELNDEEIEILNHSIKDLQYKEHRA